MAEFRGKLNMFEKVLLIIGVALIVLGYLAIHRLVVAEGAFSWDLLQTTFLWLLMVLMVILAAVNENTKEELKVVIHNQVEEIRLLRKDFKKKK